MTMRLIIVEEPHVCR